jgi:methyl-accepting chemotaxis protein
MRIRIREKLLAGFGATIVLLGLATVFAVQALRAAVSDTGDIYNNHLVALELLDEVKQEFLLGNILAMDALLADGGSDAAEMVAESKGHVTAARKALETFQTTQTDPEVIAKVDEALAATAALAAKREDVFNHVAAGQMEQAIELNENGTSGEPSADQQGQQVVGLLNEITGLSHVTAATVYGDARSDSSAAVRNALAISIVATLVGLGIAYWAAKTISGAASQAAAAADSISRGDVNVKVDVKSKDEMGDLAKSFTEMTAYLGEMVAAAEAVSNGDLTANVTPRGTSDALGNALSRMVTNLRTLLGQVKENSDSILNAAVQLGDSSDQMAAATGQIATAINEVTRSAVSLSGLSQDSAREIERVASGSEQVAAGAATSADSAAQSRQEAVEMGERIQVVATASKEVAQAADESRSAAQQGQQAVGQAVTSMESIATAVQRASRTVDQLGEYGQQIGDIVKAIDEIAAQTNLLALNAAIEAARAGEQGRGFAVVAENVRSLAERSSESTKEIADLIAKVQQGTQEAVEAMAVGVRDVQEGQRITEEAGQSLTSIIGTVELSATRMQEIARDVQGLASGAERIIASAEGIAELARESAAGAGEMAAGTTRVTEAIIQVSATSEETSASAEEVSASTEELSAQSEELAATANQMREMAEALQKASARFKLA